MNTLPVVFILGPTASGKTDLAMRLYDDYPCDLISVDSAQIYRGMDIGTAKPSVAVLNRYPHALIDILAPEESYSAAQFCEDANRLIKQTHAKNRLPVLVGGTMLYFHSLLSGMSHLPKSDNNVRADIEAQITNTSLQAMHAKLRLLDPKVAKQISDNDRQRIIRYHELFILTGKIPSQLFAEQQKLTLPWQPIALGLLPERALLHERISKRFQQMMNKGFLEEVRALKERAHLTAKHPSMRSVGYRQLWQYLEGEHSLEQAVELGIIATRQLAKRQITWMRNRLRTKLAIQLADSFDEGVYSRLCQLVDEQIAKSSH